MIDFTSKSDKAMPLLKSVLIFDMIFEQNNSNANTALDQNAGAIIGLVLSGILLFFVAVALFLFGF